MEWECPNCGQEYATIPDRCSKCGTAPEIVLNRWKCAHCGQADIAGTATFCPTCRAAKGTDVESRVDTAARLEGDQALALARGKWLYCAYCKVQVPPLGKDGKPSERCPSCRGPLSEATEEAAVQTIAAADAGTYRRDQQQKIGRPADPGAAAVQGRSGQPAAAAAGAAAARAAGQPKGKSAVIGLVVLAVAVVGGYLVCFHGWKKNLTVAERTWQRTIAVEEMGPVAEEAWASAVPAGAREQACARRIHHHDKVPDGVESYDDRVEDGRECAAHGYKSKGGVSVKQCTRWETKYRTVRKTRTRYRDVPVFWQYCRYTIDKWHKTRDLTARGTGKEAPAWPAAEGLAAGKEREGARSESYTLVLKTKDGKSLVHECQNQAEWDQFPDGSAVVAESSTVGKLKNLRPAK